MNAMNALIAVADRSAYLAQSRELDHAHPAVRRAALRHAVKGDQTTTARALFHFVRDDIAHSCDAPTDWVSVSASQTLARKTGLCFAKSHLLAALLRACGIEAGLCYQLVACTDAPTGKILHGLAAVRLPRWGWYALDARGGEAGAGAVFAPPAPCLAYAAGDKAEAPSPLVHAHPLPQLLDILWEAGCLSEVLRRLPGRIPAGPEGS